MSAVQTETQVRRVRVVTELPCHIESMERELGKGASSRVHQAIDHSKREMVAVKVLRRDLGEEQVKWRRRLKREALMLERVRHSGVPQPHYYVDGEQACLVMEYIAGETLAKRLKDRRALSTSECIELAGDLASIVMTAHAAGVVHRDINPKNVLLRPMGGVVLADWNTATDRACWQSGLTADTHTSERQTQTTGIVGTFPYLAPEILDGSWVGPAVDVFELAATVYAAAIGCEPFGAKTMTHLALKYAKEQMNSMAVWRPDLPTDFCKIIDAALSRDPQNRPTARQLVDRLACVHVPRSELLAAA